MYTPPCAAREIDSPGPLQNGANGQKVRRLQEWLTFNGSATTIDGGFGDATEAALKKFQSRANLNPTGRLTDATWDQLVDPMVSVLSASPSATDLRQSMLQVAKAHLARHPIELGGENRGPWVRLYMNGNDGDAWLWCAGFVCFVMAQACDALGRALPLKKTFSCDTLAAQAAQSGMLVRGEDLASGKRSWSDLGPLSIFLVRRSPGDWSHTGLAFAGNATTYSTIEGNTNDDGSNNGYEVCSRSRSVAGKDFIALPA